MADLLEHSPFANVPGFNTFVEEFGTTILDDFSTRTFLRFSNGVSIAKDEIINGEVTHRPYQMRMTIDAVEQQPQIDQQVEMAQPQHAIPDFITRLSKELRLSKRTIWTIFDNLSPSNCLFHNPEGFIKTFRNTLQECLADQIVLSVEFFVVEDAPVQIWKQKPLKTSPFFVIVPTPQASAGCIRMLHGLDEERNFIDVCLETDDQMPFSNSPTCALKCPSLLVPTIRTGPSFEMTRL